MEKEAIASLGPSPRKARFRRRFRNVRSAYRTVFALIIIVFGGWALLDALRLYEISSWIEKEPVPRSPSLFIMIACGCVALIAIAVLLWSELKLRRELNLARKGEVVFGQILTARRGKRKRARLRITYSFCTASGVTMQGRCTIPRATSAEVRLPGAVIEVLYDARHPEINRARLGLDFVEFG